MSTLASSVAEIMRERARGKEWFDALPNERKWGLGDVLVLGDFDWRYWGFDHRPTRAFLLGADAARINWEVQGV